MTNAKTDGEAGPFDSAGKKGRPSEAQAVRLANVCSSVKKQQFVSLAPTGLIERAMLFALDRDSELRARFLRQRWRRPTVQLA